MEPLCSRKISFYSPQSTKGVLMNDGEQHPEQGAAYSTGACGDGESSGRRMALDVYKRQDIED